MPDISLFSIPADLCRIIGVMGFLTYVLNYAALGLRFVTGDSSLYFAGNTLAATLVLISLSADFNLASAMIQVFWIGIGLFAIALRFAVPKASGQ